jgi:predicted dehydrogenase
LLPSAFPEPHIVPPASVPALRWGILGAGAIAGIFAAALNQHTTQHLAAVASLTPGKGDAFAQKFGIDVALSSYEQLVARDDVDVIYVATPHQFHRQHAELAIAAGKHVLIEKPLATTASDAQAIADAAARAGVLVMEALWTRYLPQSDVLRQVVAEGVLGDISLVNSDFGQDLRHVPRLMDPAAGGALLDLGVYNFAFASMVLGRAKAVSAVGSVTATGVDDTVVSLLSYPSGAHASITTSLSAFTPTSASISGSAGVLTLGTPFFTPTQLTLAPAEFGAEPAALWRDETGIVGHEGLSYQATALAGYVEAGLTDSPLRPLDEVVNDIGLIEMARHQVGAFLEGER